MLGLSEKTGILCDIMRRAFCSAVLTILTGLFGGASIQVSVHGQNHGVSAANIQVVQRDAGNTTNSVELIPLLSVNDLRVRDGSNRGDFSLQIGDNSSDDAAAGVLLTCVTENGRDNGEVSYPGTNFCTTAIDFTTSSNNSGYFVPVFNTPSGAEYNINFAAAYFPYAKWLGGLARNSNGTGGATNNVLTGSPGLVLGTHFVGQGGGLSIVDLRGFGIDARTNGVLLVTHARNEDNFAMSAVNTNGTWTVYVKDNGTDAGSFEQDPIAFVYIPKTNDTVISGRFRGDGATLLHSGITPRFTITNIGTGTWRLAIPGHAPETGVLILSPEAGASQNQDNIVSYQPDGDGWIIQSRDLPANPPPLQTPGSGTQAVASFVFIPVTARMSLVSPANDATNQFRSPRLEVSVSNAIPGQLTLTYYGREVVPAPGPDFTIALLPDTQFYTDEVNGAVKEMFIAQTEWIVSNRVSRNIVYVAHLGDISNSGDIKGGGSNLSEWRNATNAMYRLENPSRTLLSEGIPYGLAVGNHDQEPIGTANGTTTFYNQYFGIPRFSPRSYYGGHYGTNNDNHFDFFSAGGLDFVVLYFEFDPQANPDVLAWGNQVLETNAHRRAIVVTHSFGNTQTPLTFSAQGQAIYTALRTNENLFLMLAGHVTGEGSRVDTYNNNRIRTFVQDFQGWTNGGNGYMRTMEFSPSNNLVVVQTFSPWTGEYQTDANSEFFFDYNMYASNASPFVAIGSVSNISSGDIAGFVWSNRQVKTGYEWYVVATDAAGNSTTGPIWRFTTAPESAVSISNQFITVIGDSPTNISLAAHDANGDPLLFFANEFSAHGVNRNFDATNGTLMYVPVHGYRGPDQFLWRVRAGGVFSPLATVTIQVVSPNDTNANSIPDVWEVAYGIVDLMADTDNDGQTNLSEYFANTDPTNAASYLRISTATRDENGLVTLSWPSVGSTRYRIQYRDGDLGGEFLDLVRPLPLEVDPALDDLPSTQTFTDDFTYSGSPPTNSSRYYRIKVVP